MKCKNCGKDLPRSKYSYRRQYCSDKCRVYANRKKKKDPEAFAKQEKEDVRQPVVIETSKGRVRTNIFPGELTRQSFDRMYDASLEEELRFTRDILHRAMESPDTSPSALAALSRELVAVTERLESVVAGDDPFTQLEGLEVEDESTAFDASSI